MSVFLKSKFVLSDSQNGLSLKQVLNHCLYRTDHINQWGIVGGGGRQKKWHSIVLPLESNTVLFPGASPNTNPKMLLSLGT